MESKIVSLNDDDSLDRELNINGGKLIIVDFYAQWCGPCLRIAPALEQLAHKYPKAVFMRIDVDKCPETARNEEIMAMPTFVLYKNKIRVDMLQGANAEALERIINQHYEEVKAIEEPSGYMDLSSFYKKSECECLNESEDHSLLKCLDSDSTGLWSDCDEQLIINLAFTQAVKIHSIKFWAPKDCGPRTVHFFQNLPRTLDFNQAENMTPVQTLEIKPEELDGNPILLRFVRFQNILNLQLFIVHNQTDTLCTKIDRLMLLGSPVLTTNMGDFKRVAGKKGESH